MREWSSFLLDWTADNITDKKEIQVQVDLVLACQLQKQSYRRIKVKLPQKIKNGKGLTINDSSIKRRIYEQSPPHSCAVAFYIVKIYKIKLLRVQ